MHEGYGCAPLHWVVNIHSSFVEEVMEYIVIGQCLVALLLVAKDQVYPLVEVGRDIVTGGEGGGGEV